MDKNTIWTVVLLAGLGIYTGVIDPKPILDKLPKLPSAVSLEELQITEPSAAAKSAVAEVKQIAATMSGADREVLARFYVQFGKVLVADSDGVSTGTDFRNAIISAGKLVSEEYKMKGKYPNLGQAIDKALIEVLGQDPGKMDKAKALDALNVLAWALIK